jgi:hypothetical protein
MPNIRNDSKMMESLGNWDGTYAFQKGSRIEMRDLAGLNVGEGYIFAGDEVRRFRARYIPPTGDVKQLRLMKYVKKATVDTLQEGRSTDRRCQDTGRTG